MVGGPAIGIAAFAALYIVCGYAILRKARASGVLVAVTTGAVLRIVVMVLAHIGSVRTGGHGTFFLDDATYVSRGVAMAEDWSSGIFVTPSAARYGGSFQFGYPVLAGTVALLVGSSATAFAIKLVNVALGACSILLMAGLAERLFGHEVAKRAAWVGALLPTMVWWAAVGMKEAASTALVLLALLASTRLTDRRGAVLFGLAMAALTIMRPLGVVAVAVGVVGSLAIGSSARRPRPVAWVTLARSAGIALGISLVLIALASRGDFGAVWDAYTTTVDEMRAAYQGNDLGHVPLDVGRALGTPVPWAFDSATRTWDRGLYPGVWVILALAPAAIASIWALRRDREALALLLLPVVVIVIGNAATGGLVFRQRSTVEPLIALTMVAGIRSWRHLVMFGALGLALTSAVVMVDSGTTTALAVAAAAIGLSALARTMPEARFDALGDRAPLWSPQGASPSHDGSPTSRKEKHQSR